MVVISELAEMLNQPEYQDKTDAEILSILNAQSIAYYIEPDTPSVTNFLMNHGLYMKLLAVYRVHPVQEVRVAAESALDLAQSQIPFVNLHGNPMIQQLLSILVQGQVWTQAEADSVLDFAKRTKSIAEDKWAQPVTQNHLDIAHLLPKRQFVAARIGTLQMALNDLDAGNDVVVEGFPPNA